jgi:hypothetical protein
MFVIALNYLEILACSMTDSGTWVFAGVYARKWPNPGVGNLIITAGRIFYSYLCGGPQKKSIMSWAVREIVFLKLKRAYLLFT